MSKSGVRYLAAGICILLFLAAQTFQELAYSFWIPESRGPQDDLQEYLLHIDRIRATSIAGTIVLLLVPYAVITLRYLKAAPVAALLGLVFGAAFVGFEIVHRSLDYFVIGSQWAHQFHDAAGIERDAILRRFALWNQMAHGWFFPQMLSSLLASCCFLAASWTERRKGAWHLLAPLAFALNALRLLGRLLSTFAGQTWLDGLNNRLYYPAVLGINVLLMLWFFYLARQEPATA